MATPPLFLGYAPPPTPTCPPDDFSHYLTCPKMWLLIDSIVMHSVPIDPLKRLGLIDSNYQNLFTLSCCFHAYHAIKQVRINPTSALDFTSNTRLFSEAFIVAAHIVGLQHSSHSVDAGGVQPCQVALPQRTCIISLHLYVCICIYIYIYIGMMKTNVLFSPALRKTKVLYRSAQK